MAYASSVAAAELIVETGIAAQGSSGAAISKGGGIYRYCSSHAGADIVGAGFFTGCGAQVHHSSGAIPSSAVTRSPNNVGMRPGSLLINVESSAGVTPARVTMHAVTGSTYASSGYDCTVSAHPTT
jgi:hypothetical protein